MNARITTGLALLWVMIAAGRAQVLAPLSEVKTIVFDETGAVIPGCEIAFTSDFEEIVLHTGADGSVSVQLRDGRYTLTTSKAGFIQSRIQFFAPNSGPTSHISESRSHPHGWRHPRRGLYHFF